MQKEKLLFLNLKEDKSKHLAKVMSSSTCRIIMDLLAQENATETEIAKKLSLPLSTVHYNIEQLTKSGLVKADEYHYSSKGKEVNHYTLASKYIIISREDDFNMREKLASFFPAILLLLLFGFFINNSFSIFSHSDMLTSSITAQDSAIGETNPANGDLAKTVAEPYAATAPKQLAIDSTPSIDFNKSFWFIMGGLGSLLLLLLLQLLYFIITKNPLNKAK